MIEHRAVGADNHQVLPSVVREVGKERASGIFQNAQSGRLGSVLERTVSAIAIEPVRQPGRLANVEIVETICVEVANRHAVVAIDVDSRRLIEQSTPVVGAMQ